MKKQVSKTTPEPTESGAMAPGVEAFASPEPGIVTKPKARKKKEEVGTASAIEVTPVEVAPAEVAPEVAPAKKPKKAAAGAKGKKSAKPAPTAASSAFKQGVAAQLDAVKKIRKAKGRDLVADEPGVDEVADVLGTSGGDAEEGADEIVKESQAADTKEPDSVDADGQVTEGKLERVQKILAKAGISSRRKAEELILGGRVQINGKVVTELGTKADMERDHVRVDGKLLQGAERIRYFVLNKPKGFVTTVSDPEGRPTVMEFFSNERERLYPVGRLDYLSEGLLLVTNDGELANKLTKAASGVEKTYLVKVAGQPTEDMLDVLRQGVVIERGRPGTNSGRVRTAPAKIRQVRQGDNPWYEVIVIEGRNRELRKMFEEIGHHVEKIRRIGYGPLILDLEPGKLRELEAEEVTALRLTADGKLKPKRRKGPAQAQLPTVAGKTVRYKKADGKPGFEPRREKAVRPEFQQESKSEAYPSTRAITRPSARPAARVQAPKDGRSESRGEFRTEARAEGRSAPRGEFRAGAKPPFKAGGRPEFSKPGFSKPGFSKPGSSEPGSSRSGASRSGSAAPPYAKPGFSKPGVSKPGFTKSGFTKPGFAGKARRPEPPVTEFVLPPRKALPETEDGFEAKPAWNPDYKPGFRAGGKPPAVRSEGRPAGKAPFRKDGPSKRFAGARSDDRLSSRPQARFDESGASTAPPFSSGEKPKFDRNAGREDYPDTPTEKRVKLGIEPIVERAREQRPRSGGFDRGGGGGKPFRPRTDGPPSGGGEREFRPRPARDAGDRAPRSFERPAGRPAGGRPGGRPEGRVADGRSSGPPSEFRPRQAGARTGGAAGVRPGFSKSAPARSSGGRPRGRSAFGATPRSEGAPAGRPFTGDRDGARPFKPGAPKKFGAKPAGPGKPGADGEPRKKERWRNSFTGKNKGRPKPKGKAE